MTDVPTTPPKRNSQRLDRLWTRTKHLQKLYLLVFPTTLLIAVLGYYPKIDVIIKSFFRWQPPSVNEYIGFNHFVDAFADPIFWSSFQLVFIMLVANLFKMWPGIFAGVALHRISNDRLRYILQVCFVVPMVIPGMVTLLIWKSFYDPDYGIINRLLNATGLMSGLDWLDVKMPALATRLEPMMQGPIAGIFGNLWGLMLVGAFLLMAANHGDVRKIRHRAIGWLLGASFLPFMVEQIIFRSGGRVDYRVLAPLTLLLFIGLMWGLVRTLGPKWVVWMFLLFGAVFGFRGMAFEGGGDNYIALFGGKTAYLRLFLWMGITLAIAEGIRSVRERFAAEATLKTVGTVVFVIGGLLLFASSIWTTPTQQFSQGTPAWLGNKDLVIPALIFWGFPWINTVGVLIYLAGLQQIPIDVYEAAELDGIGPVGMLFRIELPLILTQVRINLIFMTIMTLTTYEMFLILLGPNGGPDNRGMVPGLYMFSKAFLEGKFGYACALGMVLFVMILGLTVIYNKYVKIEK